MTSVNNKVKINSTGWNFLLRFFGLISFQSLSGKEINCCFDCELGRNIHSRCIDKLPEIKALFAEYGIDYLEDCDGGRNPFTSWIEQQCKFDLEENESLVEITCKGENELSFLFRKDTPSLLVAPSG